MFILSKKLFLFLRFLNLSPDFFGRVVKQLKKKAKINFKMFDVINWETNSYNTYISQYLKR